MTTHSKPQGSISMTHPESKVNVQKGAQFNKDCLSKHSITLLSGFMSLLWESTDSQKV